MIKIVTIREEIVWYLTEKLIKSIWLNVLSKNVHVTVFISTRAMYTETSQGIPAIFLIILIFSCRYRFGYFHSRSNGNYLSPHLSIKIHNQLKIL